MSAIQYIIISSISVSSFYILYLLIYRNESNFRQLRIFLLASILISLLIPCSKYKVNIDFSKYNHSPKTPVITESVDLQEERSNSNATNNAFSNDTKKTISINITTNWFKLIKLFYCIISLVLIIRIIVQIIILTSLYFKSDRLREDNYIIIYNSKFKKTFSFFNWIFINKEFSSTEETNKMLAHEIIHVSQYHSIDLIVIEMLVAVMWFNPLVWMMRNTIQVVHEYLADEGALSTGIDKLKYQALLINQVIEERLLCLSSSFNRSLIKKRMIMMTKIELTNKSKFKISALLPMAAILLFVVACVNGQNKGNIVSVIEPKGEHVLYIGVDNPVKIVSIGQEEMDFSVTINGTMSGDDGEYIICPNKSKEVIVTVSNNGKIIENIKFKVALLPEPAVCIETLAGKETRYSQDGNISKKELLSAGRITAGVGNFNHFFKVESFVLKTINPDTQEVREEVSKSEKFTEAQIDLINSLVKNQEIMIDKIIVTGQDGIRKRPGSRRFTINGT